MRSNYHSIKAIIDNSHSYSEMIHGITAYTQGLFRANVIKIKNTVDAISHATCGMSIDIAAKAIAVCSLS